MDVSVQREVDGRFLVKLAGDEQVVNVCLSASEVRALVGSAHWSERGTMRAGESEGAPVLWASDGSHAKVLIRPDDVANRDIAINVPFRVLDEIVRGSLASEISVTFTQSYEPPPPDDGLVRALRAAVASIPDLHEAYLVVRKTQWPDGEIVELGVVAHAGGGSRSRRSKALRLALAPFSPPSETAPLGWVAYSNSPVRDRVRRVGIRLA